jgi:hypothetical protein
MSATGAASRTERRIGVWTLLVGFAAAIATALAAKMLEGLGLACGSVLAWLNFRWMKQAFDSVAAAATAQAGAAMPKVPFWVYVRFFLRYVLMGVSAYAMMAFFAVPLGSIVIGLFSLGVATLAASVYELLERKR